MMSVQLKIWKQLITSQLLLSAKPHITFVNICTQKTPPSTIQPQGGFAIEFLLNKCGLTDEDIPKAFKHCNYLLRAKSSQNMNEVLGLLNGCGLSTPTQIRKVVLCNPQLLFLRSESNLKPKLNFFRTFMKEEDISKLFIRDAKVFSSREEKLKSAVSLLQTLGFEGTTLSHLLVNRPRLLTTSAEKVMEEKVLLGVGKEKLERKLHSLNSLGFSEKQVLKLPRQQPRILKISDEKMKRHVDFMVNFMGLPLNDVVKYTNLFTCSLEKRIIPRFKVMKALNSMHVQDLKRGIPLQDVANMTEKDFLEKYVDKNVESSYLWDIYHGREPGKLIINKETASECVSIKKIRESSESLSELQLEFYSALIIFLKFFSSVRGDSSMVSMTQQSPKSYSCIFEKLI